MCVCLWHCFGASDTLFRVIDRFKDLKQHDFPRCRGVTCPCCFFLLMILFVCFSPGLKRNVPGNTSKSKRDANSIRIPAFQHQSLTKLHQTGLPRVISCLGLTFKKIAPCGSFKTITCSLTPSTGWGAAKQISFWSRSGEFWQRVAKKMELTLFRSAKN